MNLSIQDEFYLLVEELQRYLSPHILQQLAQETGFVKHKSKYFQRIRILDATIFQVPNHLVPIYLGQEDVQKESVLRFN